MKKVMATAPSHCVTEDRKPIVGLVESLEAEGTQFKALWFHEITRLQEKLERLHSWCGRRGSGREQSY